MNRKILCLMILTLLSSRTLASDFVGDGFGALGRSLGGALVASKKTGDAMFINPAAISGVTQAQIQTGYNYQYGGACNEYYANGVFPMGALTLGAALPVNMVSGLMRTQENAGTGQGEQIGSINQLYAAGLLSAAYQVNSQLALGVTGRGYYQMLDSYTGLAAGVDVGARWQLAAWSMGAAVRHLGGTRMRWSTGASEVFPMQYALGLANTFKLDEMSLLWELGAAYNTQTGATYLRSGAEASLATFLRLRAGYGAETQQASLGVGLDLPELTVDYALVSHPTLGLSHQAVMTFKL